MVKQPSSTIQMFNHKNYNDTDSGVLKVNSDHKVFMADNRHIPVKNTLTL